MGIASGLAGWLGTRRETSLLLIGLFWVVLTVAFEVVLGREAMHLGWDRIWADYDVTKGGLMPFGLLVMGLAPLIGSWLRRRLRVRRRRLARQQQLGPSTPDIRIRVRNG